MTELPESYEQLSSALHKAALQLDSDEAALAQLGAPRARRRWWRNRGAAFGAVVVLGLSGTATAAVLLRSEPSSPLVGSSPVGGAAPIDYRVGLTPSQAPGLPGWCLRIRLGGADGERFGAGCAPISEPDPIVVGWYSGDSERPQLALVVGPGVAGVSLPGGRLIDAIAQPELPAEFKAVVTVLTTDEAQAVSRGASWHPFGPRGAALPEPSDHTTPTIPTQTVQGATPAAAACQLDAATEAGAPDTTYLEHPVPSQPARPGGPLLSCARAVIAAHTKDQRSVALLVDLSAPDSEPGELPGAQPTEHEGVVRIPSATGGPDDWAFARRVSRGWLLAEGGNEAARLDLLRETKASASFAIS